MKKTFNNKMLNRISMIILGVFIMTIGTYFFNVPSNIAAGGVTGFAQVIKHLLPSMNLGILVGILNLLLFIIGMITLGKEFGLFTLIGAGSYTLFLTIFDAIIKIKEPILSDGLANLVIGAFLVGFGLARVFNENASTGGTDVLAKIVEKYSELPVGKAMLAIDTLVIIFAATVFGIESGIYSFLSIFITTYVLDVAITGFNTKIAMTIISDKVDEINNFISITVNRGSTIYKARGGYTKQDKDIIVTIVDKKQYLKIRNYIRSIDENAFVYTSHISEVIGYGFSRELADVSTRENTEINN